MIRLSRRPPEDYVTVTALLAEVRDKSIRLDRADWHGLKWVPRAWLDKQSDLLVVRSNIGDQVTLLILGDEANRQGLL